MLERARRLAVERGQVALERRLGAACLDELEVGGELRVVLGGRPQGLAGMGNRLVREGELAARAHRDALQVADRLARGGHHAPHAVDLVAKELDAHGRGGLGREDVDGVAVDVEGARPVDLARVRISQTHEQGTHVLEGHLVAHGKRRARPVARAHGRHAAQQRAGTRHDDARVTGREPSDGLGTGADDGIVRRIALPRQVAALGIVKHHVLAEPRLERVGRSLGGLLARDDEQARPRVLRPDAREHERAGTLGDGHRGVVAGAQL